MKKALRFTCFIISAIIALSAISCNSSTIPNDNEQETKANDNTITANTVLENTEEKSDKLAKYDPRYKKHKNGLPSILFEA